MEHMLITDELMFKTNPTMTLQSDRVPIGKRRRKRTLDGDAVQNAVGDLGCGEVAVFIFVSRTGISRGDLSAAREVTTRTVER